MSSPSDNSFQPIHEFTQLRAESSSWALLSHSLFSLYYRETKHQNVVKEKLNVDDDNVIDDDGESDVVLISSTLLIC